MADAARPATVEDLKRLIEHLNREGVDYLLVGGYALMALGYQRGTTDIDLLLPRNVETGKRIKRALLYLPETGWLPFPIGIDDDRLVVDYRIVRASQHFIESLRPPGSGSTAEY